MTTTLKREDFLRQLETIRPGLSPEPLIQQSDCVLVKDGYLATFNGDICCRTPAALGKEITIAVRAGPILNQLPLWQEDVVTIDVTTSNLVISGKNKEFEVRLEKNVLLPVDAVEAPGKWRSLPEDFKDGIGLVESCASKNKTTPQLECVHFSPKYFETFDNNQLARFGTTMSLPGSVLVKIDGAKHAAAIDATEYSLTDSWMHFRNPAGLIVSCRRYLGDYPNDDGPDQLTGFLEVEGVPTSFPKAVAEAADRAAEVSREDADNDKVLVKIKPGLLQVTATAAGLRFRERKVVKYDGPRMAFLISPVLLSEIVKRFNDCQVAPTRLKVVGGKFSYVTLLKSPAEIAEPKVSEG